MASTIDLVAKRHIFINTRALIYRKKLVELGIDVDNLLTEFESQKMIEIKPPADIVFGDKCSIFLGGSIEMGTAEDWQTRLTKELTEYDVVLLNPRRDDWDPSWIQSNLNIKFKEQVTWELDALDCADLILFYFDPNTKSPITLLELGLFATLCNVIVCCPDGFWRKGNIEIVCDRYDVPLCNTFDELISLTKTFIKERI